MSYWFGIVYVKLRRKAYADEDRRFGSYRTNVSEESSEKSRVELSTRDPYRKPTLVDRASSPRGTSESSSRNSAKKRP